VVTFAIDIEGTRATAYNQEQPTAEETSKRKDILLHSERDMTEHVPLGPRYYRRRFPYPCLVVRDLSLDNTIVGEDLYKFRGRIELCFACRFCYLRPFLMINQPTH